MEKAGRALNKLSEKLIQHQTGGCSNLPTFETLQEKVKGGGTKAVKHALQAVEHEIRNPLTAVGGFTRRLAKEIDPGSSEWNYVQIILSETERLEKVLKGLGEMLEQAKA